MDLNALTIKQLHDRIKDKDLSVTELVQAVIKRKVAADQKINAYLSFDEDGALEKAKLVDENLSKGFQPLPLTGIPMAIMDNICVAGVQMSCASKMLEGFIPPHNATVVDKLNEQKSVLLGKVNMDEFAISGSLGHSSFKKTLNPWDDTRVPGGSSGGSAASVASGEALFSLGTDTGGGIRQPASFCGVVGLKPTYGRVSRYGLAATASSLVQIGSLTRNVTDAAIVLQAIAGKDARDCITTSFTVPDYATTLAQGVKGLRVGLPKEYFSDALDNKCKDIVLEAAKKLEDLGAIVEECSLPYTEDALAAYLVISSAEASSNLARFDGVRYGYRATDAKDILEMYTRTRQEGFGFEVKKRLILGTYLLSAKCYEAYYLKALKVRTLVKRDFDVAFESYDCLLSPTALTTAFGTDEYIKGFPDRYQGVLLTASANMAGIPAISIPCGFDEGLPVGLQLMGKAFAEETILKAAFAYEQSTQWHQQKPSLN